MSRFPTRHVQIILHLYGSISEILTGFDVDASCVAFDGARVLTTPRGLAAFVTQVNNVDLSRRSPSYEMRLAKYRLWGFEIYWPELERSRVNERIFYKPIDQVNGLARLLVLEWLFHIAPCKTQPWPHLETQGETTTIRDSGYQAFRIPYGPKFDADKVSRFFQGLRWKLTVGHLLQIENILRIADLSMNGRAYGRMQPVSRHRHHAFWGALEDIIGDCCGVCPQNLDGAQGSFVSGPIAFVTDNPGRQRIGSFHPLTEDDWTDMAYAALT